MTGIPQQLIDEVRARTSLVALIGRHVQLKPYGRAHVGLCPFHNERTPSFNVSERRGRFHCFGCGADGDAIEWMTRSTGASFPEAVKQLAYEAGLVDNPGNARPVNGPVQRPTTHELDAERILAEASALAIWNAATADSDNTPVQSYLRSRGITISPPPSIRYAPVLVHRETGLLLPGMVAAVQSADRSIKGIHRTFLTADGRGKANVSRPKKMKGTCWGGAIRLSYAAETLIVCEGIETGLSLLQSVPGAAVWCAGSLDNLAGCHTKWVPHPSLPDRQIPNGEPDMERPGIILPAVVREVTIAADADNSDPEGAEARYQCAARRWSAEGRTVRISRPPTGMDFNDVLMAANAERNVA